MDALPKTHLDLHGAITLMDEEQNKMLRNIQRGHLYKEHGNLVQAEKRNTGR